ncbi:OpgC domain-containing protein [Microbacterium timonense]|uniref:OpgC domain-containing protein n=1 Tax=Microbacterium timonense TaxID=2086576 RepID=UPI000D0EC60B|nr:OpgC domain-containing protein [Microbacterium timonense]
MTPTIVAAAVIAVLLSALVVLQAGVAAGAPWGRLVWGGGHRVLPARLRVGSAVSVILYAAFAGIVFSRAGVLPGGDTTVIHVLTWALLAYFVIGIVMNAVSRSRPERLTMTPVCVVLAAATLVVARG